MHKDWSSIEELPYCFSRLSIKFQGHRAKKNIDFDPKLGFFGLQLQCEFTDGYEMMLIFCSSVDEVPFYFSRSSVKFQGHKGQLSLILSGIECYRTVTPVWIHWWLEMIHIAWSSIEEAPYCLSRSSITFQGHTWQKLASLTKLSVSGL